MLSFEKKIQQAYNEIENVSISELIHSSQLHCVVSSSMNANGPLVSSASSVPLRRSIIIREMKEIVLEINSHKSIEPPQNLNKFMNYWRMKMSHNNSIELSNICKKSATRWTSTE